MEVNLRETERLAFFKDLYEEAKAYSSVTGEEMIRRYEQYKGSKAIDGSSEDAGYVRNITYELIESQITSYIPNAAVTPQMASDKRVRNAKSIETYLRNMKNALPFEEMNDIDERYTYIYGGSVWLIEWDESITTHTTVGGIKISVLSPQQFVPQPGLYRIDDMEYLFVTFETTREDIVRRYGVSPEVAEEAESEEYSAEDKTATLVVCYFKNDEDKICQYIWSGDTEIKLVEDYWARKRYKCKRCGKRKELCGCDSPELELMNEEFEEVEREIKLTSGEVISPTCQVIENGIPLVDYVDMPLQDQNGLAVFSADSLNLPAISRLAVPRTEPTRLPFYTPTFFPVVIRKNTSEEKNLFGQSDCDFIRPEQQAINKVETRILQKLLRSGVYPVLPDDANVTLNNSVFGTVIRAKPGQQNAYSVVDTSVDISRDIVEANRIYDNAKRIMGISDSFQGQYDASAKSGVAKQVQVSQSAGRLNSKRQMKNAAYADIYRIIFQLSLAYADEPRPSVYKDAAGRLQNSEFLRYDFFERDEAGEWYVDDRYLFEADPSMGAEYSRERLWETNMANFRAGAYGDPSLPETQLIYWQNMESAHYPWASENVERLRMLIERTKREASLEQRIADLESELAGREEYEKELIGAAKEEISEREAYASDIRAAAEKDIAAARKGKV